MAKDHRLVGLDQTRNIGYGQELFTKKKNLNFDDLFETKASTGLAPWMPSRFTDQDFIRKLQTQKLKYNPTLNFVGDNPEEYEVFAGLGRFKRKEDYNFDVGRPLTANRPEDQPGFSQVWVDAYNLSPTVNPDKRISNPMPRLANPDPRGYLMATAQNRVENEMKDNKSVSQLLSEKKSNLKSENKKGTFQENNQVPKA